MKRTIEVLSTLHSMAESLREGGATVEKEGKIVIVRFHHGAHHADRFEACLEILLQE